MEKYIQVGQTALRSPSGEFLPAVPLYEKVETDEAGMSVKEEHIIQGLSNVFCDEHRKCIKRDSMRGDVANASISG